MGRKMLLLLRKRVEKTRKIPFRKGNHSKNTKESLVAYLRWIE